MSRFPPEIPKPAVDPRMKTLLSEHLGLVLALVFFLGWTVHWIVGLLFFRERYFEQEALITKQTRALDELRFTLGRAQSDLVSRSDLLEAVQKSRTAAETRVVALEKDLAAARGRLSEFESLARTQADAAQATLNRLATAEAEVHRLQTTPRESTSQEPELKAELATAHAAVRQWVNRTRALEEEVGAALRRAESLERTLAATESVNASLQSAVRDRDTALAAIKSQLAEREAERSAVSQALAAADAELSRLRKQSAENRSAEAQLGELRARLATTEIELENLACANASLSEQLDAAPVAHPITDATRDLDALLADLDAVTRERNEFAAELAALRTSTGGSATPGEEAEGGSPTASRASNQPAPFRPTEDLE